MTEFKWNPFTMLGESPSSLRFFAQDDEIEFATKEDLEAIKADPRLSKIHQSMLAGVNKKFQERAESERKLQQQVTDLEANLSEWEEWGDRNRDGLQKFIEWQQKAGQRTRERTPDDEGERRVDRRNERGGNEDERFMRLERSFNQAAINFRNEMNQINRMLSLSMQLNDLYRQNPQMDGNKVLDIALKKGYSDLSKAYQDDDAYGKEILSKRVDEALKPRLEEELAKRNAPTETGSGSVPLRFDLPKDLPKSFTDAGTQFLQERAKEQGIPSSLGSKEEK